MPLLCWVRHPGGHDDQPVVGQAAPPPDHGALAAHAPLRGHVPGMRRRAAGGDLCTRLPPDHGRLGDRKSSVASAGVWRHQHALHPPVTPWWCQPRVAASELDHTAERARCGRPRPAVVRRPGILAARGDPTAGARAESARDRVRDCAWHHDDRLGSARLGRRRPRAAPGAEDHRYHAGDLRDQPPPAARPSRPARRVRDAGRDDRQPARSPGGGFRVSAAVRGQCFTRAADPVDHDARRLGCVDRQTAPVV